MGTQIPGDDSVLESDELDVALFWHTHKKNILLGLLAVLVIGGGGLTWYVRSAWAAQEALVALANARDVPALEAVVSHYRGTMPAANAELLVAAARAGEGKYEEAIAAFKNFLQWHPTHPLAGGALLGVGQSQDAAGKAAEAAATYQQVMEKYPKSYAAPFAGYAQAEMLLRDFKRDEAKVVLNSLVSQFPDSRIARLASAQLVRLGRESR